MDTELLQDFKGEYCRVVYNDGFKINGIIRNIKNNSFTLETKQGISVVDAAAIKTVIKMNGGRG